MDVTFLVQQLINGLSRGAVYALIATGFALIFSVLKFSNFAHGGLISVSAYAGYFFSSQLKMNPVLAVICTALTGAVLGTLLDFIAFRNLRKRNSSNIFYFVSSITCGILFMNLMTLSFGTTFYSIPPFFKDPILFLGDLIVIKMDLAIFLISIGLLLLLMLVMEKTKMGLALRTVAIDREMAMLMGINSNVIITITFLIAGALAGVSGILLGSSFTIDPFLGNMVVKGFVASVIGGLGSLPGAIIGAVLLGVVEVFLTVGVGDILTPAVVFVFTLFFLLVRPQGIRGQFVQEKA
ncbi:branched-chain amino acid ABC transporter permease [Oscillospiraceae bacterium MB08-C2-2]|nr:branched-chain amino acid ABC transporter permease [Oscillospiraceae bacterium MB08-C2-2]